MILAKLMIAIVIVMVIAWASGELLRQRKR